MIMSLSSKKQNKLDISRNNETGTKSEADSFTRDLQQDEVSLIDTSQDETKHLSEREIPNHESPEGQRIITKIIASIDDSNDESISLEKNKMKRLSFAKEEEIINKIDDDTNTKAKVVSPKYNRSSLSPSTVASSILSPEPTIDLGALGLSLGIANGYSVSENIPIYSESELKAKIDAAIADATSKLNLEHKSQLDKYRKEIKSTKELVKESQVDLEVKQKLFDTSQTGSRRKVDQFYEGR